ncbi:MAG: biotin/lipoyl-binding protein [Clostridia bacterium]|nr:biotin/lipoyl-binding protein [Clostridia bacterium]
MKKYNVNVNGTLYEITLEVVDGAAPVAAPAAAPAPVAAPAPAAAPAPVSAGAEAVNSPMPGTILAVNVAVGDTVKAGDVLMVLEAMKMENEISAPKAGKVTAVSVTKGATVESGAQLCVIE